MIDQLTRQDFADLPEGALQIEYQGALLPMQLREVRELPPGSPRQNPFAVVLAGPADPVMPQGIHPMLHPRHGRLELFMVPIGRDSNRTRYEIIFN